MPNPFSLADVPDPNGPDVQAFAREVPVAEFAGDENAMAWVTITTESNGLDGAWSSRWRTGSEPWQQGVATFAFQGDRVHILFKDSDTYLFEGIRQGDRVIGRAVNVANGDDTSPWVGILVSPYRIDGYWAKGRWDFRRCSPDERPEPIVAAVLTEARQLTQAQLRELLGFARYLRWRGTDDTRNEP